MGAWENIKSITRWENEYVIGYGPSSVPVLREAYRHGARVFGVVHDNSAVPQHLVSDKRNRFWQVDVEEFVIDSDFPSDVAICFDLEHLDDPDFFLTAISTHSKNVLVRDGINDKAMNKKLHRLLPHCSIENLGHSIWRISNGE